jgi:hypothetical protein
MIEVSNLSVGKNLCNILAELIVKEIDKNSPGAKTEISVVNVRSFFIVKGITSSDNQINVTEVFKNFYKDYCDRPDEIVKIFDLIKYSVDLKSNIFQISLSIKKEDNSIIERFQKISNEIKKDGYDIIMKIDKINKTVHYDIESIKIFSYSILKKLIKDYTLCKDNFSNEIYKSDKFYGLSNNGVKYYYVLVNKILYNLLNRGFCNNIEFSISNDLDINDINNENINLKILNDVSKEGVLESLVLDVFDFEYSKLKNQFDLSKLNLIDSLENNSTQIWENYLGTKDLMFL